MSHRRWIPALGIVLMASSCPEDLEDPFPEAINATGWSPSAITIQVGETRRVTLLLNGSGQVPADEEVPSVQVGNSNPAVASFTREVVAGGVFVDVTGVAPGQATITASTPTNAPAQIPPPELAVTVVEPPATLTVSIQSVNDGRGSVVSDVPGIDCNNTGASTDCSEAYPRNTQVGLTASPLPGDQFDGWQGDCTGTGPCSLVMDADKSVTAVFSKVTTGGATVSVSIRDDAGNPVGAAAAAAQIGDQNWTPLTPTSPGQYAFDVPAGETRYGFAARCGMRMQSFQATTDETTDLRVSCPNPSPPAVNYGITWSGVDNLRMGSTYTTWHYNLRGVPVPGGGASGGITLPNQPGVPQDLALVGMVDGAVVGARIIRNATPAAGSTFVFPFTAADRGDSAVVNPFSTPGGGSGNYVVTYGTPGGLAVNVGNGTASGGRYYTLPSATGSGDAYVAFGIGFAPSGGYASHALVTTQGGTVDFILPATWDDFVPPTPATQFTLTNLNSSLPEHRGFGIGLEFMGAKAGFGMNAFVSCGWLGSSTSYTLPNPAGLVGFEEFVLTSGDNLTYTAETIFGSSGVGEMLGARLVFGIPVVPGLSRRASGATGSFTVP